MYIESILSTENSTSLHNILDYIKILEERIARLERLSEEHKLDIWEIEEALRRYMKRTELELPQQNYDD